MDVIGTVAAFLAVLVVLVVVHELGHFLAAKAAGVTVQEFAVGFPPRITSRIWRGTRYSLNWLPLGGFVKMLGEDGDIEAKKMRESGLSEPAIEKAMEGAFNRKPLGIRLAVLLAGVLMNFVLAGILFSVYFAMPSFALRGGIVIDSVQPDSPAQTAGLRAADVIVSADGRSFESPAELSVYMRGQAGQVVELRVRRADQATTISVTPRQVTDQQVQQGIGAVGFGWHAERVVETAPPASNPFEAVAMGFTGPDGALGLAAQLPGALVDSIGGILGLNPNAGQALGPIGIAEQTGRFLEGPFQGFLYFVGLLSINLAVVNVLPFPPLDGGRILVVLVEAIGRRRLPAERAALIYFTGFMVLIALVILISIQDVQRLIEG
ncbi:MAG TPA: M50 family metallopeptidase [Candidatus Limnocylindria bacterium]|jgi:regulator of sigma E protease|nr:M50 family metallopeptidase [Candidatus Limnocylindria bacterium]